MERAIGKRERKTKNDNYDDKYGDGEDHEQKEDCLSSLPDNLLVDILSFLPIKSVIATSALSSRWCHLWTQITSFCGDFDDLKVVDGLLAKLTSQVIRKFMFTYYYSHDDSDQKLSVIRSWFHLLCGRKVEEIQVISTSKYGFKALSFPSPPPCIFQTQSLVELGLGQEFGCSLPLDGVFNLPNLKILRIHLRACNCKLLSKLIKSCPVLEDLYLLFGLEQPTNEPTIVDISGHNLKNLYMCPSKPLLHNAKVIIDAPKLRYLNVGVPDYPLRFCFLKNPIGLNRADIFSSSSDRTGLLKDLFGVNISNVKMLKLKPRLGLKSVHGDGPPVSKLGPSPLFPNLTQVTYATSCSTHCHELIALLQCCPVLQSLSLKSYSGRDQTRWNPSHPAPALVLTHLKSIYIGVYTFRLRKHYWLNLVEYLPMNAPALEHLTVTCQELEQYEESLLCKELYKFPRSSLCCEIRFNGKHLKVSGNNKKVKGCDCGLQSLSDL